MRGRYGAFRTLSVSVNLMLAVLAVAVFVSGAMLSEYVFGFGGASMEVRQIHSICANWLFVLAGAHRRAAEMYFNDGSIEGACPPLKALLHIMRDGSFEGKRLDSPEMRDMLTFENIRKSEWYAERLIGRQQIEVNELQCKLYSTPENQQKRVAELKAQLKLKKGIGYLKSLAGTLGADPYIAM